MKKLNHKKNQLNQFEYLKKNSVRLRFHKPEIKKTKPNWFS